MENQGYFTDKGYLKKHSKRPKGRDRKRENRFLRRKRKNPPKAPVATTDDNYDRDFINRLEYSNTVGGTYREPPVLQEIEVNAPNQKLRKKSSKKPKIKKN